MQRPSLTLILSGIFLAYIGVSIHSMAQLFVAPSCDKGETCIRSSLVKNPSLELYLFSSPSGRPSSRDASKVRRVAPFNYSVPFETDVTLKIPMRTRNNGTLFLHVFLLPVSGSVEKTFPELLEAPLTSYERIEMTQYVVPQAETFNLLGTKENEEKEGKSDINLAKPTSHLQTRVTFVVMTEHITFGINRFPAELVNDVKITRRGTYLPILKYDFLQTRHSNLVQIRKNDKSMNVTIAYTPITLGALRWSLHIEAALQSLQKVGFTDKDVDEVKGIYSNMNVYVLAVTMFIISIHLLFDFLAFKNDINFWRNKNNLQGLSTTTIVWRAVSQMIIFLYLLDENSSLLILIPTGIGTLIEIWKSKKILRIQIERSGLVPRITFQRHLNDSAEAKTRQFDAESLRYLSYLLYPLVVCGAIYSLLYQPHKSWYSWSLNSLVNGVYAFGFLFMLPQLFVNYKLKSVAHLPWRAFMYKAFNTFIDDVFAFIITMPTAHRVACFRDDAVFLIYLYQRWLYPVDKNRLDTSTMMDEPKTSSSVEKKEN